MATSEKARSAIVIKRIKKGGHGGHAAAWKIAYADFVTAMMAFFLLMWLLGSTTSGDLKGIAEYFQSPLRVAMSGGSGAGDATTLIQGGGPNLTASAGQVKQGDNETRQNNAQKMRRELARLERQRMNRLKQRVDAAIQGNPRLTEYKQQIRVEVTTEGLRIQIIDDFNRPMFELGSSAVLPYMREILRSIGATLNDVDSRVALSGHTDSAPYAGGQRGYSNWELSADRANASRRELLAGGLAGDRIVRVVGLADSNLLDKSDPRSPLNRRIAVFVLNKIAEDRLAKDGSLDGGGADDIEQAMPTDAGMTAPVVSKR